MVDTPSLECSRTEAGRVIGRDLAAGGQDASFSYENRFENNENSPMEPLFADLFVHNRLKVGIVVSTSPHEPCLVFQNVLAKPFEENAPRLIACDYCMVEH